MRQAFEPYAYGNTERDGVYRFGLDDGAVASRPWTQSGRRDQIRRKGQRQQEHDHDVGEDGCDAD